VTVAEVVDSHVHLLPGRLGAKVRTIFTDVGGYDLAYPADHAAVCEQLAAEGVAVVWTLPYAHRPGVADSLNRASAATAAADLAVQVVAGATVHPGDDDPVMVVRRAVEDDGARVLKLHCSVGRFDPLDPALAPVWDYVEETRLPVVVHAGRSLSWHSSQKYVGPDRSGPTSSSASATSCTPSRRMTRRPSETTTVTVPSSAS